MLIRRRGRENGSRRRGRRDPKAADCIDRRRLRFGRRRGDSSRSQNLRGFWRLWRERSDRAHRAEHARRAGDPLSAAWNRSAPRSRRSSRTSRSPRSRSACSGSRRLSRWWRSDWPPAFVCRKRRRLAPLRPAPFLVYDPVMIASSGDALSGGDFVEAIAHKLLPLVDCLTPNLAEAAALLGEPLARSEADMARQGAALLKLGPRAVLMKGGHLEGKEAVDLLVTSQNVRRYSAPRVASRNLHGTGCTLVERHRRQRRPWHGVAGGCGVGQGVCVRGDQAGPPRHARRRTRSADPDEAALKLCRDRVVIA